MRVSIVTGAYNAEKHLPLLYQSILNQIDLIHEWIICDDGSPDNSMDLIKEYVKHPKISAYWQSNTGNRLSASLNNGLRRATGDVIFIILGDTYLQPDTMTEVHKSYISGTAGSGLKRNVIDEKFYSWEWRYNPDSFGKIINLKDQLNAFSYLTGNVMLVGKDDLAKAGYYNEDYCYGYGRDDWSVFLRLYDIGVPLVQYNNIICDHVWHGEGQPDDPKNLAIFQEEYDRIKNNHTFTR